MKRKHIDDTTKREQLQRLTIEYEELGKRISILKDEVKNQEMNDLYEQGYILVFTEHDEDKFANKMFLQWDIEVTYNLLREGLDKSDILYDELYIDIEELQRHFKSLDIKVYDHDLKVDHLITMISAQEALYTCSVEGCLTCRITIWYIEENPGLMKKSKNMD